MNNPAMGESVDRMARLVANSLPQVVNHKSGGNIEGFFLPPSSPSKYIAALYFSEILVVKDVYMIIFM